MKHKTFLMFVLPSALAMITFIFFPLVSIAIQSFHGAPDQIIREVESCDLFGCKTATVVDQEATEALRQEQPLGRFVGFEIYKDRGHLAVNEVTEAWASSADFSVFLGQILNLPFYKALFFTLSFTFVVTPFTIFLGFLIAVAVNSAVRALRGLLIFVTLLPMIVTPLVGSLILFWMIDARGIIGAALQSLAGDPSLSVKASTPLMWVTLMAYGVWHAAPFAFIVYYAGLQTLSADTLEAAMIDGATRLQRIRYVVLPHLLPLTTFVALIQLMDNFRVFEPIVSFAAGAHATSLSYAIFNDLGGETRQLASAAATSVLTIIGVAILLTPVIIRTWREFGRKRA